MSWPTPEMTKSRTCQSQKMAESKTLVSFGVASYEHSHFRGGQFKTVVFLRILECIGCMEGMRGTEQNS